VATAPIALLEPPAVEVGATPAAAARDRTVWALAALLVGAAFLRVWQLDAVGFNSDETVYVGQAAAIAHVPALEPYFPIFRAHPLLFQSVLSAGFRIGLDTGFERLISGMVGLVTIVLTYETGRLLYGRRAGLIAALVLAVMPYHVVVTRQVLLDGPMTLCATLALYLMVRYVLSERAIWLYAAGGALGLTVLSKETGIVLAGAVYAFFALSPGVRLRPGDLARSMAVMVLVIAPYPLALLLSGETGTGGHFLSWQLLRPPNHTWTFYATTVPGAVGPLVLVAAVAGVFALYRERSWRETLLLAWMAAPLVFFSVWPVKGYQYLLPAAPPLAILAGRALASLSTRARVVAVGAVALSLLVPTWQRNKWTELTGSTFLAHAVKFAREHKANIFFKAKFSNVDKAGLLFHAPEKIYKVQRRKDANPFPGQFATPPGSP